MDSSVPGARPLLHGRLHPPAAPAQPPEPKPSSRARAKDACARAPRLLRGIRPSGARPHRRCALRRRQRSGSPRAPPGARRVEPQSAAAPRQGHIVYLEYTASGNWSDVVKNCTQDDVARPSPASRLCHLPHPTSDTIPSAAPRQVKAHIQQMEFFQVSLPPCPSRCPPPKRAKKISPSRRRRAATLSPERVRRSASCCPSPPAAPVAKSSAPSTSWARPRAGSRVVKHPEPRTRACARRPLQAPSQARPLQAPSRRRAAARRHARPFAGHVLQDGDGPLRRHC